MKKLKSVLKEHINLETLTESKRLDENFQNILEKDIKGDLAKSEEINDILDQW